MVALRHDRGRVTPHPGGAAEEILAIALDPRVNEENVAAEYRSGFLLVRPPCRRSTRGVEIQVED